MSPEPRPVLPVVFISSTVEDLAGYRRAADEGARIARCFPEVHELWVARDHPPLDECLERVRKADVLVVIVAYRYGWVPPDQAGTERKSITWLECEEAAKHGREVLAFLVDEAAPWPEDSREEYRLVEAARSGQAVKIAAEVESNIERLRAFKTWLRGRGIRGTFTNPEDLRGQVATALHEWRQRHPEFDAADAPAAAAVLQNPTPYIQALREETGYIEIRGVRTSEGSVHRFAIRDLYLPLVHDAAPAEQMTPERDPVRFREGATKQGLDRALEHAHLVIVGDPGSGKTTFLHRVISGVCESRLGTAPKATAETAALDPATLPVLIRIADLAEFLNKTSGTGDPADSPMWIVRFLAARCEPIWGLGADFFLKHLKERPCLLALDGLDEAPDARVRERLSRSSRAPPECGRSARWLVTTRPKAYTDEVILAGFHEARIANLDGEMIRTLPHAMVGGAVPGESGKGRTARGGVGERRRIPARYPENCRQPGDAHRSRGSALE